MAIYTVGYSRLTPAGLLKLVTDLRIDTVIDARSVPTSRRPGFGRRQLETLLGGKYQWRGEDLGGRPPGATTAGLAELRAADASGLRRLVVCMEHAAGDCHRHHTIGLPLALQGIEVLHIFEEEVSEAKELQRAMDDDDDYSFLPLAEHIAEVARRAPRRPAPGRHRRTKGSGMGYLSSVRPVSFRLTTAQHEVLIEEAEARATTLADLARNLVLNALDCARCNVRPPKATS